MRQLYNGRHTSPKLETSHPLSVFSFSSQIGLRKKRTIATVMKYILIFLLAFSHLALTAEPLQVALLGDPNSCDLLAVELSDDKNIVLLERDKIKQILEEQRLQENGLSCGTLKRYFPHTDIFAILSPTRLVVFNARNGFRLRDDVPDHAAEKIRSSISKLNVGTPYYLSIASVRDVGVPLRLKPKIEETVSKLEQELMQYPEIQMLERERLGAVLEERELSGKQFALTPSTRLLTLEFETSREAELINAKILITDLDKRMLKTLEFQDCFRDIPATAASMSDAIYNALSSSQATVQNRLTEAARFFAEYKAAPTPAEKKVKLAAALALAPMNENYRYAEIKNALDGKYFASIEEAQWVMERTRRFFQDFPNTTHLVWSFDYIDSLRSIKTDKSDQQIKNLAREFRTEYRKWMRKQEPFPDGPLQSMQDLQHYRKYIIYACRSCMYLEEYDPDYVTERKEYILELLKRSNDFFRRHPEQIEASRLDSEWIATFNLTQFISGGTDKFLYSDTMDKFYTEYYTSLDDFVAEAQNSPLQAARFEALLIQTLRKFAAADNDAEKGKKIYLDYFVALDKDFPEFLRGGREFSSGLTCQNFLQGNRFVFWNLKRFKRGRTFALEMLAEYFDQEKHPSLPVLQAYMLSVSGQDPEKALDRLLAHTEDIHSYAYRFMIDNRAPDALFHMLYYLSELKNIPSEKRLELLRKLNGAFDFQELELNRVQAAEQCGNDIFLVSGNNNYNLELWRFDGLNSRIEKLSDFDLNGADVYTNVYPPDKIRFLRVTPTHFIFAGPGFLALGERGTTVKWTCLKDLPPDLQPRGLAVIKDRIYLLSSGSKSSSSKEKILLSFDMTGKNRKIHFATARSENISPLDSAKNDIAACLLPIGDEQLLFAFSDDSTKTDLWLFTPGKEQFRKMATLPSCSDLYIRNDSGAIWATAVGFGNAIYRIDPENWKTELFFLQHGSQPKGIVPQYRINGNSCNVRAPFIVRNGRLWTAGEKPYCINLAQPERSDLLALPLCIDVFADATRLFYVSSRALYVITPKAGGCHLSARMTGI